MPRDFRGDCARLCVCTCEIYGKCCTGAAAAVSIIHAIFRRVFFSIFVNLLHVSRAFVQARFPRSTDRASNTRYYRVIGSFHQTRGLSITESQAAASAPLLLGEGGGMKKRATPSPSS